VSAALIASLVGVAESRGQEFEPPEELAPRGERVPTDEGAEAEALLPPTPSASAGRPPRARPAIRGGGRRYIDAPVLPLRGGIRLNSFWVFSPTLSTSITYDDNVRAAPPGEEEGDLIANGTISGRLQSTLARHSFGVDGQLSANLFSQDNRDDVLDWFIGGDARLDLTRRTAVDSFVRFRRDQTDFTDPEQFDTEDRIDDRFTDLDVGVGLVHRQRRWNARLDTSATRVTFDETDDRDRLDANIRASYQRRLGRRLTGDVGLSYRRSRFPNPSVGEADRDSQRAEIDAGVFYTWPSGLSAGFTLGFLWLDFSDPDREDRQNIDFSLDLGFDRGIPLTEDTFLSFSLGRNTDTTTVEDFSFRTRTFADATITHVLGADWSTALTVGATRNAFDETERVDHDIFANARLSYAITNYAASTLSYTYDRRFGDEPDDDFRRNLFRLGVTVAF
jgi:hypothetical protein